MFWLLIFWGCLYCFHPTLRPSLGMYCHKATGISLDQRPGHSYLCVCIHCFKLKLRDGLLHTLLYPHPKVLHVGQCVIHRAKSDAESLSHLQGGKAQVGRLSPAATRGEGRCPLLSPFTPFLAWLIDQDPGVNSFWQDRVLFASVLGWEQREMKLSQQWWLQALQLKERTLNWYLPRREASSSPTSWTPSESVKLKASECFSVSLEWTYWTFPEVRSACVKELIWMPSKRWEPEKGCQEASHGSQVREMSHCHQRESFVLFLQHWCAAL